YVARAFQPEFCPSAIGVRAVWLTRSREGWWVVGGEGVFEYEYEYEYRPPGRTEYEYEVRLL
ncbi:MAG: hypothetical protein ACKO3T_22225, partial [Planctomycetaceae bacterium]